jgi:acylpyruvate hydrolase
VRTAAGTRAAAVVDGELFDLGAADVGQWLAAGSRLRPGRHLGSLEEADLAPVVPRPSKIVCLGLNYRSHIEELGLEVPAYPTLFAKFASALVGAGDPIVVPAASTRLDWEVELALVVGKQARNVGVAEADGVVAGYTVLNDVSARDFQHRTSQWLQGKTFDLTTPVGPVLASADELGELGDLRLVCEVDGQVVQQASASDMVFGPAEVVSYVSSVMTLFPGDLISTGTPSGVGHSRRPPTYLRPGQVVRSRIEGIGELVNTCVAEGGPQDPRGRAQ